jgi:DNA mismatch endonuclease Vsr
MSPIPESREQLTALGGGEITEATRRVMRGNRGRNTRPEISLRRLLHRLGYRFRLHWRILPGSPDVFFTAKQAAIQVHGCFWHRHAGCPHSIVPRTRKAMSMSRISSRISILAHGSLGVISMIVPIFPSTSHWHRRFQTASPGIPW